MDWSVAEISGALSAQLIDELPVLAAIAPYTRDGIRIRDARELRVKESDRIALVAKNLRAMGAKVEEFEDGLDVAGGQTLHGADIDAGDDHRIAMAFAVAALRADGQTTDSRSRVGRNFIPGVFRFSGSHHGAIDRRGQNKKARSISIRPFYVFSITRNLQALRPLRCGCRSYSVITVLSLVGMERLRLGFRLGRFAGRVRSVPERHFRWLLR